MILVLLKDETLSEDLRLKFEDLGLPYKCFNTLTEGCLNLMYRNNVRAVIAGYEFSDLPSHAWYDMLLSLGRRKPVVVIDSSTKRDSRVIPRADSDHAVSTLVDPSAEEIIKVLQSYPGTGLSPRVVDRTAIKTYDPQIALDLLRAGGAFSVLVVDGSSIRGIAIQYGSEAYQRFQICYQKILFNLWGAPGCFRKNDILVRKAPQSNDYYIFLQQSRNTANVPAPGQAEKLANRIAFKIQSALWGEVLKPSSQKVLPDFIQIIPEITVGYFTSLYNPCVDPTETVDRSIRKAINSARIQQKRLLERQREIIQTIIKSDNFLTPHFQGVFNLEKITKEKVDEAIQGDLAKIGIKAKIVSYEWGTYLEKTQRGEHDMALLGWTADIGDPDNFLYVLLDKDNAVEPAQNISFYKSDRLHKVLKAAKESFDKKERIKLYREAQKIIHEDVPLVPLAHSIDTVPLHKKVKNFVIEPTGRRRFAEVWLD